MATITLNGFDGLRPRTDSKLLKSSEASQADNCDLSHGSVNSWRKRNKITTLKKSGLMKTIYLFDNTNWLHWIEDVDVVRGPIANDTTNRLYFTGTDAPRVTDNTLVDSTAVLTGVITGVTQATTAVVTDVAHGLFTGAKVLINNIVGMTELNGRNFTITVLTPDTFELDGEDSTGYSAYVSGGDWARVEGEYPEDSYIIGVPAPVTAPSVILNGTHTSPAAVSYVYTFVNDWGEESAPSPVSTIISADYATGSVDITLMDPKPSGDYNNIGKWRIYRVASGVTGALFLFVAEVVINTSSPQYNDTVQTSDLGEAVQTAGWLPPKSSLVGLTMMGNGIMAGFSGNDIYFSKEFIPYSWPDDFKLTTDYDIIGIGSFGNSLVVVTNGFPYLITGTAPEQMSIEKLSYRQPGVSKRGIVSVIGGVIWPTPSGLFYVGDAGSKLLTKNHYTRVEWDLLFPSTSFAAFYDNRYIAFMPATGKAIVFSMSEGRLTEFNASMDAIYSYIEGDRLYFANDEAGVNTVFEFNAGGTRETYTYKSKTFSLNNRIAITSGKVYAEYSATLSQKELDALNAERDAIILANTTLLIDTGGAANDFAINEIDMNGDLLQDIPAAPQTVAFIFKLYGDGSLIFEKQVTDNKPFRIRTGGRYVEYEIEVSGQYPIQMVKIATSIAELKR